MGVLWRSRVLIQDDETADAFMIDDFEKRVPYGVPSLRRCDSLTVEGDVTFGAGIEIVGDAVVRAEGPSVVPDGTVIRGNFVGPFG